MAKLIGYAVPLTTPMPGINQNADHTYVRTADGRGVWGCWGRSSGGREICRGTGSSKKADCISKPWSTAGLVYGVTGVCHQTANRILYPAGVIVSHARAYWLSSLVYGTYGTGPSVAEWPLRRAACYFTSGDKSLRKQPLGPPELEGPAAKKDKAEAAYVKRVQALYEKAGVMPNPRGLQAGKKPEVLSKELEFMVDYRMGKKIDPRKKQGLLKQQGDLHRAKRKLDADLYAEAISPREYANRMNRLANILLKRSAKTLGAAEHRKFFGLDPGVEIILVDPDIAEKAHTSA